MEVINRLDIYEIDGNEVNVTEEVDPKILIRSHDNYQDYVIIETPDGHSYVLEISALKAAINNASNLEQD